MLPGICLIFVVRTDSVEFLHLLFEINETNCCLIIIIIIMQRLSAVVLL